MLGLIALAATPLLPAPDWYPALSLDDPIGRRVYVAAWLALSFGFLWRRGVENTADAKARNDLREEVGQAKKEAAQHHADSERRHETQMAAQQEHHDTQMAAAQEKHEAQMPAAQQHSARQEETYRLVLEMKQQSAEAEAAHAPAMKVVGLNSAVTLAEAALAEEAYTIPHLLMQGQGWVTNIQPYLGVEELPVSMRELQDALRNLEKNPPTDPITAIATAKQLSSLSLAIPNAPVGPPIADHKADVGLSMPSESSSGAHRPPKSSSWH